MAYVIEYMRLGDVDPFIEAPYLIAARGGEPAAALVPRQPGSRSLRNQRKYLVPRVHRSLSHLRHRLPTKLGGKSGS